MTDIMICCTYPRILGFAAALTLICPQWLACMQQHIYRLHSLPNTFKHAQSLSRSATEFSLADLSDFFHLLVVSHRHCERVSWSQAQVRWSDCSKLLSAFLYELLYIYYMSQLVNRFSLITAGALFEHSREYAGAYKPKT